MTKTFPRITYKLLFKKISRFLALVDRNSTLHPKSMVNRFTRISNSSIGKYSYVGPRSKLYNADIGSFCSISWDCFIGLSSHEQRCISTSPIFFSRDNGTGTAWVNEESATNATRCTVVGHDVWIGANCIVMEGVRVGHGSIIAAGAIVTRDVPPYSVVGGVPARHIKYRFPEPIVDALLAAAWWNAPDDEIRSALNVFRSIAPDLRTVGRLPRGTISDGQQGDH